MLARNGYIYIMLFKRINDRYAISADGIVYTKNKELSQKTKSNGYKEVCLYINKKPKMKYVHRLVAEYFLGGIPKGHAVNHIDGDKSNNSIWNLEVVTYSENSLHSHHVLGNKAPIMKGEKHPKSKVTKEDVIKIRELYDSGVNTIDINKQYNSISLSALRKICYRSTWKHI